MKNKITFALLLLLTGLEPARVLAQLETDDAEKLMDLRFDEKERALMQDELSDQLKNYEMLHQRALPNSIPPAITFNPIPVGFLGETEQRPINWNLPEDVILPASQEELAFYSVAQLAQLIKSRQITSVELTQLYLERLQKYSNKLNCVVTLTEELAMEQARQADEEIAAGNYRGPLHGIPYGVKDLLAVEGYKTTWGAMPYKDQMLVETATVVEKLTEAGAVLIAKLSMGALAMGDVWFQDTTRNPWNLEQGSSGSSAGSAAATAAGLVGFSIGTETLGSIVSPSTRCGVSGLRPTYGRVSRTGAMALSWSMDKIGPMCRTAEDCALVFEIIRGQDGIDQTLYDFPFNYDGNKDVKALRVGYLQELFTPDSWNWKNDSVSLQVIRELGVEMEPVSLPDSLPVQALFIILSAEASAAFDDLTRSDRDSLLVRQDARAWPNYFRASRFIPAVEYIQANRWRYLLIQEVYDAFKDYDVIVTPSFGGPQLLITNLTGNPCVVVPNGFNESGSPTSLSFIGNLYQEASLLSLAKAFQEATDFDEMHPEGY